MTIFFGGDYNPEQWPESVWRDDIALMREAHVNLVTVGVFSWARIQRREGEFDFAWLDRVLGLLHEAGVGVDLATATASPPPWLVRRHPDILPVTAEGVTLGIGSRQQYAPTSPDYRRAAAELVHAIAARYAQHPAVKMWHVNNEYSGHVREDFSEHAARAFREWLAVRYHDIEALNAAWGTAVWSQQYGCFEEIQPPRASPTTQNPSAMIDFRRFTSDSVLELYTMERDIIRAEGATQPILTNFMGPFPALDYWRWAEEVDIVADDSYPDPRDPDAFRTAAFGQDLMRSLRPGRPWILMEQAPNAVQWRPNNAAKRPGQMAAWSEQAIARGASGVLFFQWRQARTGQEKFHSGMLPHSGRASRTWREVARLGAVLRDREPAVTPADDVAILFDWENWWALSQPNLPADLDYLGAVSAWHAALHSRNVPVAFAHPTHDLSRFRLVIAPAQYLLTEAGADSITRFVEAGGVLVTTAFTDIVDEHDHFRPDGFGTQLAGVLGGRPIDFRGVEDADDEVAELPGGVVARPQVIIEDFVVESGTALGTLSDGGPALVANARGSGYSLHLTSLPDEVALRVALDLALARAGLAPVVAFAGDRVEAIPTRHGLTVINHNPHPVSVPVAAGRRVDVGAFDVVRI